MTHPNASTAFAEVVVDELVRGGVRDFVVAPGSRSAALAIAAARHEDVALTVLIDERSAAFFALGIGKETGRPAAVLTTSGSAVAHLYPAVVEADTGRVPLLLLTADRPPELHGVGANQTIEQSGLFGTSVRDTILLGPGEHDPSAHASWRAGVCRGIDAAVDGPVHLNLAFREPLVPESDDGRTRDRPFEFDTSGRPDGARWLEVPPQVTETAVLGDRWTEPERGVVVAGDAPHIPLEAINRLAAALGWPLIIEPTAGSRPAQAISTAHHLLSDPELAEWLRPDVALVIGRVNLSRPVTAWLAGVRRLVVDSRITRPPDANAELASGWPVIERLGPRDGAWRRRWLESETVARGALDAWLDGAGLVEPRIARDVAAAVPPGGVLLAGSSMPIRDLDLAMRPGSVKVLSNRGASGIDGVVSTAFGVASVLDGPVVVLTGDLALLHDSNGFLVEPRPDVVFVVVNNDGGGIFSFLPQVRQTDVFEQVFGTPHGRSFEMLAAFHGVHHRRLVEIGPQIEAALGTGGTWILEAVTDRSSNPEVHRELTRAVVTTVKGSVER
ncbi:MAG: 2-succinyl-5-enolpyruvyl-6-hydroxy-3-cyclohexene-1-carboxylic-acid synthase [Acidimicrobiia bacterium]